MENRKQASYGIMNEKTLENVVKKTLAYAEGKCTLMGEMPESCEQWGTCSIQNVVEADGSVYPCDFYALDEYKLGNLAVHA